MTKLEQDIEDIKKQLDSIVKHFNIGQMPLTNIIYIRDKAKEKAEKFRNVNTPNIGK